MPTIDPYLIFNGNARQAMEFYHQVLGGEIQAMMTHAESPMAEQCSEGMKDQIMHACLVVDGRMIMASDNMPSEPYNGITGCSIALSYPTAEEGAKVFKALAAGGSTYMDLMPTFWAETFGMCKDKFGASWMVVGGPKQFGG